MKIIKNIKLTQNHKSKLLEMCKELFPEVNIYTGMLSDGSQAPENVLDYPLDLECGTEWDLPYISIGIQEIHWFEFCVIDLRNKLKLTLNENLFVLDILNKKSNEHIIDFLYKIFKKI